MAKMTQILSHCKVHDQRLPIANTELLRFKVGVLIWRLLIPCLQIHESAIQGHQ